MRFVLVPVALTTPLLARVFSTRFGSAAVAALALVTVGTTLVHSQHLPVDSSYGWSWNLTQAETLDIASAAPGGYALKTLNSHLPPGARVGAILASDEPAFLLYGGTPAHRVSYLPVTDPIGAAGRERLRYLVVSYSQLRPLLPALDRDDWSIIRLAPTGDPNQYWVLAVRKNVFGSDVR